VYVEDEQKLEERANALDFIVNLRANEISFINPAGDVLECAKKIVDARIYEIKS